VIAAARNGSVESGGLQPISHEPDPSDPRSLVPYLPLTAYQADSAGAILTIAQSQVSGVTSPNSIRTEVGGLCLTILKDFAHLPVAPPVVHRSIPEPVLHNLWDGDVIPTQSSDSISEVAAVPATIRENVRKSWKSAVLIMYEAFQRNDSTTMSEIIDIDLARDLLATSKRAEGYRGFFDDPLSFLLMDNRTSRNGTRTMSDWTLTDFRDWTR
jgi:hypothetical protein